MNTDLKLRGVKRRLESSAAAAAAAGLRVKKQLNSGHHRPGSPASSPPSTSSASLLSPAAKVLSSASIESLSLSKVRQLVFNLSMCKLSRYRQTPDPSLHRSVLICNTLKRLERELDREGIRINFGPNGVSFLPPNSGFGTSLILNNHNLSSPSSPPPQSPLPVTQPRLQSATTVFSDETPSDSSSEQASSQLQTQVTTTKFSLMQESSPSGRLTPFLREEDADMSDQQSILSCDVEEVVEEEDVDSGLWSPDAAHHRLASTSSWEESMSFSSSGEEMSNDSTIADMERPETQSSSSSPTSSSVASTSILLHELRPPATQVTVSSDEVTSVKAAAAMPLRKSSPATSCPSTTCSSASSSSSSESESDSSTTTTEEIFGDIDLSLYDFDLLSPIAAPIVKMNPLTAEELMRSITPAPDDTTTTAATASSNISVHNSPVHVSASLSSSTSTATVTSPASAATNASCPSTSCATQSTASVVFSKLYISKKDPLFLDEMPTAIS